jgi:hypothetical protein
VSLSTSLNPVGTHVTGAVAIVTVEGERETVPATGELLLIVTEPDPAELLEATPSVATTPQDTTSPLTKFVLASVAADWPAMTEEFLVQENVYVRVSLSASVNPAGEQVSVLALEGLEGVKAAVPATGAEFWMVTPEATAALLVAELVSVAVIRQETTSDFENKEGANVKAI